MSGQALVGVDTGGTFTDVICDGSDGRVRLVKLLSTPDDPSEAIGDGIDRAVADTTADGGQAHLIHGTTVATNAVLERDGARVALVTTAGFEDLLELRRQHRPDLYDFHVELAPPVVDSADCLGVAERIGHDEVVLRELTSGEVNRVVELLVDGQYEAIGVCLLHAYANPTHEQRLGRAIRRAMPEAHVSLSHEVVGEFREYERASTTSVNAFVGPTMSRYLQALSARIEAERIDILQSSGGRSGVDFAADFPVHTVLSGPAGGVVGALSAAREVGLDKIITFDMGGTSTDVSLCDGGVPLTSQADVGGLPIHVPMVDIHTVGAGGGSIAYADPGGALRVGPRSAGADPGPACYGQGGTQPTVTDAHVYLGRLRPNRFLGGRMSLDVAASERALAGLATDVGLQVAQTARGILEIADAEMIRAIKVTSLERGHDPRQFCLVAFGGAGAMHACRLAERLEISTVLVPEHPGVLSAYGMLNASAQRLYSTTVLRPLGEFFGLHKADDAELRSELSRLQSQAAADLDAAGSAVSLEWSVDLRYQGQSFEISVPVDWEASSPDLDDPSESFARRHQQLYGYRADSRPVEFVTLRLKASIDAEPFTFGDAAVGGGDVQCAGQPSEVEVGFADGMSVATVAAREQLDSGQTVEGPAVVTEYSSTTIVPRGWGGQIQQGHLLLTRDTHTNPPA